VKKDMEGTAEVKGVKERSAEAGRAVCAPGWGMREMEERTDEKMEEVLLGGRLGPLVSWKSMPITAMSWGLSGCDGGDG
jgi:hypothetical protein